MTLSRRTFLKVAGVATAAGLAPSDTHAEGRSSTLGEARGVLVDTTLMKAGRLCGACHDGKKASGLEDDCTACHRTE